MNTDNAVVGKGLERACPELVALDLDDTTLNSQLNISPRTKLAIQRSIQMGVRVVLATGRMIRSAAPYAAELGITGPLIAYNGAVVAYPGAEVLDHFPLTLDQTLALVQWAKDRGATLNLYLDEKLFVSSLNENVDYYTRTAGVEALAVGDLSAFIRDTGKGATKALVVSSEQDVRRWYPEMRMLFGETMNVTGSKPRYIEIMDKGVNKGRALASCAGRMGISPDRIMAVGNALNDLEMIEYAGLGVAVANSHPLLLERADAVVGSNDEDGVAEALERFVLAIWEKLPGSSRQDCF